MIEGASLVLDLLKYIEQVEKLKSKPAFTVPSEFFVAHETELHDLPEVQFNLQSDGDDVWLRIPRLQEIAAPEPDEALKGWVTLPKSPEKDPALKTEVIILEGRQEVGRKRLEDHPEVKELFDWYVEFQWMPWAEAEHPRRNAIGRYNQLFSLQQAISSEGAETPLEVVWGIGYAAWKKEGFSTPVKYPLLVQACEITLNEKTFDLEVRPRGTEPRLEADCYAEMELSGVKQLDAFWRATLSSGANRVNPFEPSTYEGVLRSAVGHLDPSGNYEERAAGAPLVLPSEHLKVTNSWVLFGRKRSGDIFLADIERLKKKVEQATELPGVIRSFVERGSDTVRIKPEMPYRGLGGSDAVAGASELYFPMPYNDEQVSIVQKLHANEGVVVQGPPGTGKTHTIANVICHYLAQGLRVLVTAKGESALAVLQEKLPERIRPLCVSLLSDERDGMKQFEHSIQSIASSVSAMNPSRAAEAIRAGEELLNRLHAQISHLDQTVTAHAAKHLQSITFQGKEVAAGDLAKQVVQQSDAHEWFDDEPSAHDVSALTFIDADIQSLRHARKSVGEDLGYLACSLPKPDTVPTWADLLTLHRDLVAGKSIDAHVAAGALLPLVNSSSETFVKAKHVLDFLDRRAAVSSKLLKHPKSWHASLAKRLNVVPDTDQTLSALVSLCMEVRELERQRRDRVALAIGTPADSERHEDFCEAVARLVEGKSAFALFFGKAEARKLIASVTVAGVAPDGPEEWKHVQQHLAWRVDARKAIARWNSMASEFDLQAASGDLDRAFRQAVDDAHDVEQVRQLVFEFERKLTLRLEEVFGKRIADRLPTEGEALIESTRSSLQAHVDKGRLGYAILRRQEILGAFAGHGGPVVDAMRDFLLNSHGKLGCDESVLQTTWLALCAELQRLVALRPQFNEIERVCIALDSAGAIRWAKRCRTLPASPDLDVTTPTTWTQSWEWRAAVMFLDSIDGHHTLRDLFAERRTLAATLSRTYQELVAEKTWLGVYNNSPDAVRQALQAYLNAVQAMGSGAGIRAVRHRKTAREAMERAYQAVPCWVLPQWRVSEAIPAELALFDLVIIDEASQSDIWALPALLRGKKVLVVGDHKQVSPSAVGTAEEKIKELIHRFLANQPFGSEMTPDKSIYDLARVVFAGNSVMLKEHFRSVPAIIEFSNREFYQGDIRPLRVPRANERLDPPLIEVFVKGGARKADVNEAEATAIVREVQAILADPQLAGRSIGVVTLVGTAQAKRIHDLIGKAISPIDIVKRKIAVGPPPVFQGRERDIMMISMVLGPGDRGFANRADTNQRVNVALSRARDRMYLFRSLVDTEVSEDSLTGRIIRHFKQPFRQDPVRVDSLRDLCESGFEREIFDAVVNRGYRVQPQVPCGGFRIDFVIEGTEGRRLAIECDGDRFHGPGQWHADMARQRVLERAGWTFWRCFASSFVRRRTEVLDDLYRTLDNLGIQPIGADDVDSTEWVAYKEVDPFEVDKSEGEAAVGEAN